MTFTLTTNFSSGSNKSFFNVIFLIILLPKLISPTFGAINSIVDDMDSKGSRHAKLNGDIGFGADSDENLEWTRKGSRLIESVRLKEPSWNVAIYKSDSYSSSYEFLCSGVLIEARIVLSSYQCLKLNNLTRIRVRDGNHLFHKIRSVASRQDYNSPPYLNDIALVILENPSKIEKTLNLISQGRAEHYLHNAGSGGNLWVTDMSFIQPYSGISNDDYKPDGTKPEAKVIDTNWEPELLLPSISKNQYDLNVKYVMKLSQFVNRTECQKVYDEYLKNFITVDQRVPGDLTPTVICIEHEGTYCEKCRGNQLLISSLAPLHHPGSIINFSLIGNRLQSRNSKEGRDPGSRIELYTSIFDHLDWIDCVVNNANETEKCDLYK